ncbi:MAG: nitrate- and nitrite sensing domain-containing protein [Campylobacterales bacterium]|nr:nitrate- and nitrite sensing domain-containing protein [Campylobacterales bacterium]
MKNLSISSKLFLTVAVPVFGFLIFSISGILESNNKRINVEEFYSLYEVSYPANALVTELQKERELSLINNSKIDLTKQRANTDKKLQVFLKSLKAVESDYAEFSQVKKRYVDFKKDLVKFRGDLDNTLNVLPIEDFFENKIEQLIFLSEFLTLTSLDNEISTLSVAKLNILKATEKAYAEKTLLLNVFSKGVFTADEYNRFKRITIAQNAFIENFQFFADTEHRRFYNSMVVSKFPEFERYKVIASSRVKKSEIISEMREVLGYGGFIHNFKNYVVRSDRKYLHRANDNFKQLNKLADKFLRIDGVTEYEKQKIATLVKTITEYKNYLDKSKKRKRRSVRVEDSMTRNILDNEALLSLEELSKSSVGIDASIWNSQATKRVDILKDIDNSISDKLLSSIVDYKRGAIASLIFLVFTTFAVAFATIVAIFTLVSKMNKSLANLEMGLNDFIRYIIYKDKTPNNIEIFSEDIIGMMSRNINDNLELVRVCQKIDEGVITEVSNAVKKAKTDIYSVEEIKCFADNVYLEEMKFDFNDMIQILKDRTDELNNYKENLEEKISIKTRELEEAYQDLEISSREIKNYNRLLEADKKQLSDFSKYLGKIQSVDVDIIVRKAMKFISKATDSIFSRFYIYNEGELKLIQNGGVLTDSNYYDFKDLSILNHAIETEQWVKIEDIEEGSLEPIDLGVGKLLFTKFYAIPVVFNKKKLGVLVFGGVKEFNEEFLEGYIQAFGSALSAGISYKLMIKQSSELESLNSRLAESEKIKNNFFSTVSHGIESPLRLIAESATELSQNFIGQPNSVQSQNLNLISHNTIYLLSLIKDIQNFSKIEAGKMALESEKVDLIELVKESVSSLVVNSFNKSIAIDHDIRVEGEDYIVHTDKEKLKSVILGLADNAVRFVESGTGAVSIVLFEDENNVIIAIKDNGIGIPQEEQEKIFDAFSETTVDSHTYDTGLGLTVAKSITELLGGNIQIESEVGKGSVFGIVLPLKRK